ncbi:MAG: Di-heme cytochrome, transrane [Firmicutes bacterium]|nr:Di-heme cytochrome, transrane [Bacillota bacterium]
MKLLLHPLPVRFFHWTMVASVLSLLLTGLFLSSTPEWLRLPTRIMRQLHGSFGMVLIANLAGQIYYYVYTGKFTEVLLLPRDMAVITLGRR